MTSLSLNPTDTAPSLARWSAYRRDAGDLPLLLETLRSLGFCTDSAPGVLLLPPPARLLRLSQDSSSSLVPSVWLVPRFPSVNHLSIRSPSTPGKPLLLLEGLAAVTSNTLSKTAHHPPPC